MNLKLQLEIINSQYQSEVLYYYCHFELNKTLIYVWSGEDENPKTGFGLK